MRKHYKRKKGCACPMCKAYKTGGERRWTGKAFARLQEFERLKVYGYESKRKHDETNEDSL